LLEGTGVPVAPVLTVPQALALDQVAQRNLLHEVSMPNEGERSLRVLGSSVHVDGQAVGPPGRPPVLGEHVDDVLAEIGYTAEEIADLRARGVV
jgi:crotonobetainyl-CoA:carnitine CoA-transferase CaiB-like acyl-CoA transferase